MEFVIAQETFTPRLPLSDREMEELSAYIEDALNTLSASFEVMEFYDEQASTGDDYYTEASEGIFTKIGKMVATLFEKLGKLISSILGKNDVKKWDKLNRMDKVQEICKQYPAFQDQIMVSVQKGLIDIDTVKDMNDFMKQFAELNKWGTEKEYTGINKIFKAIQDKFDKFNNSPLAGAIESGSKTIKTFKNFSDSNKTMAQLSAEFLSKAENTSKDLQRKAESIDSRIGGDPNPNNTTTNESVITEDSNDKNKKEPGLFAKLYARILHGAASILSGLIKIISPIFNACWSNQKMVNNGFVKLAGHVNKYNGDIIAVMKALKEGEIHVSGFEVNENQIIFTFGAGKKPSKKTKNQTVNLNDVMDNHRENSNDNQNSNNGGESQS